MMKHPLSLYLLLPLTALPVLAGPPLNTEQLQALEQGQQERALESTAPSRPVEAEAPVADEQEPTLSEAEERIRVGIVMLARLHELLSGIKDEATAEAAVAPIMRQSSEFLSWAQGFSSLPPLDADTQREYERRYLPIIDELNTRIRIQGERLASAEFYGSQNLPAALVRLVTTLQQ